MSYAELHCLSNFSFLQAASHPDELITRASELGYQSIAITDRNTLAGVVRAYTATKDAPIKLIVGSEITPEYHLPIVLWAKDRSGYRSVCRLITRGRRRAAKGECQITIEDIASSTAGLLAGLVPPARTENISLNDVLIYREIFGDRLSLLAELHRGPHDSKRIEWLVDLARQTGSKLVAAGQILFHHPHRRPLYDVLTAIRLRSTVHQITKHCPPNAEQFLRDLNDLKTVYASLPKALKATLSIAEQCTFSLNELRYEYPEELAPSGQTPIDYLKELTWAGAKQRYPKEVPQAVRDTLERELQLIEELNYEAYFLTVWDLVRFARSREILCQGRGSAANSAVCYCLGITSVDPKRINLLFERFISRERDEAPDIDVDFEHERREEVLQYIYQKYGRERAGIAAVTTTYRPRSAIRDVGKALGLSLDLVDRMAKNADHYKSAEDFPLRCREAGLEDRSRLGQQFLSLVKELQGFPRHLSQHVGGMVIARGRLDDLVPIENAAMPDRTVVQWNKDDLDDLGILKVDCLSLGMLTAIRKGLELIKPKTGRQLTLADIPEDDQAVYDMICRADTVGVFQIESRAQMSMLPRLKPQNYYDLVIEVAIVRPGPIQGDMVHPYLRRRNGDEKPQYPNKAIEEVLKKTLGVPLFQEQCMQLAIVAAGFTPGEADQLRRAMGAWRRPGLIDQFRQKLMTGMEKYGLTGEFAEQVFHQIRGFGEYGFPESHAASFALLVYVSAWLKCHYPAEFTAAVINSQPMGFYAPAQLIRDVRDHGVTVLPIDINRSDWDCTIESGNELRLGFRLIKGLQQDWARRITTARRQGQFLSMKELLTRTRLPLAQITLLAEADVFRGLKDSRRESVWKALAADTKPKQLLLFEQIGLDDTQSGLPEMTLEDEVYADYHATGLSLRPHPLAFHRTWLSEQGIIPHQQLKSTPSETFVKIAGIVLLRQRPSTAKGITFVTIEDETGTANLVFHTDIWERYRQITRHSSAWIVEGKVESKDTVIHVIVKGVKDLSKTLNALPTKPRNFR